MSNLENLSDDQLGNLIKLSVHLFSKKASNVDYTNLSEIIEYGVVTLLDEIGKYFGIKQMDVEDTTFVVSVLSLNKGYKKGDIIKRPTLKNFEVIEYEMVWEKREYIYSNKINSYVDLDNNLLGYLKDEEFYSIYDGDAEDENVWDTDYIDSGIKEINLLNKKK
jgi:hypothetical protein